LTQARRRNGRRAAARSDPDLLRIFEFTDLVAATARSQREHLVRVLRRARELSLHDFDVAFGGWSVTRERAPARSQWIA